MRERHDPEKELNVENPSFDPKISIITVTYNADSELEQTVASVAGQTYRNIEFIIIDGNSNDRTREIIDNNQSVIDYFVSEPDNGIYDAMNKGLEAASGDYVLFLNAGDYFVTDESLENIISRASAPFDILYGDITLVYTDGTSRHHKALQFSHGNLKKFGTGVLCHQAIFVSRKIAPRYDTKYVYKGELNWYFDIFQNKPDLTTFHYQEPLVYYFLGGKGYQDFLRNRMEWYRILISRFGIRTVFNRHFLKFIWKDFQNRYGFFKK